VAETTLNALGLPASELAVTIVGDRSIRILNRDYLGKDHPTNVISFPMNEGECSGLNPDVLGDVVISAATAAREAAEADIPYVARLSFLLLHGILHLAGYDHERSGPEEATRMEEKERELFALLTGRGCLEGLPE
jgi:probable rRNA maturation factor